MSAESDLQNQTKSVWSLQIKEGQPWITGCCFSLPMCRGLIRQRWDKNRANQSKEVRVSRAHLGAKIECI